MNIKCNWNRVYKRTEKDISKSALPDFSGIPDLMLLRRARTLSRMEVIGFIITVVIVIVMLAAYLAAVDINYDFFTGFCFIVFVLANTVLICAWMIIDSFEAEMRECISEFQKRNSKWKDSSYDEIRKSYRQIIAEMSNPNHNETHESIPMSAWKEQ